MVFGKDNFNTYFRDWVYPWKYVEPDDGEEELDE